MSHIRKASSTVLDTGMPCQLSLMLSGRSHVQTPASESKRAGYIWTLLYFLSSSLCDCRRCYFQPCLINMCHIRCEKYSQGPFTPFDTLAIIQGNCHHFFYGPSFTNHPTSMNHPQRFIITDIDLNVAYSPTTEGPFTVHMKLKSKTSKTNNKSLFL